MRASQVVLVVKNPPAKTEDMGLIPGLGRSPEERNGNPLQYSRPENPMDRGAWRATVHRVAKELDTTERTWILLVFSDKNPTLLRPVCLIVSIRKFERGIILFSTAWKKIIQIHTSHFFLSNLCYIVQVCMWFRGQRKEMWELWFIFKTQNNTFSGLSRKVTINKNI